MNSVTRTGEPCAVLAIVAQMGDLNLEPPGFQSSEQARESQHKLALNSGLSVAQSTAFRAETTPYTVRPEQTTINLSRSRLGKRDWAGHRVLGAREGVVDRGDSFDGTPSAPVEKSANNK